MNDALNADTVSGRLKPLTYRQLSELARLAGGGVSFYALLKIRSGETKNPGIETVRAFWHHIDAVASKAA